MCGQPSESTEQRLSNSNNYMLRDNQFMTPCIFLEIRWVPMFGHKKTLNFQVWVVENLNYSRNRYAVRWISFPNDYPFWSPEINHFPQSSPITSIEVVLCRDWNCLSQTSRLRKFALYLSEKHKYNCRTIKSNSQRLVSCVCPHNNSLSPTQLVVGHYHYLSPLSGRDEAS